jgi:hypothetical protein
MAQSRSAPPGANPDVIDTLRAQLGAAIAQTNREMKGGKPDEIHEAKGRLKTTITAAFSHGVLSEQLATELYTRYELAGE